MIDFKDIINCESTGLSFPMEAYLFGSHYCAIGIILEPLERPSKKMDMVRYIKIQGNGKRNVSQILDCKNLHQKAFSESIKIRNTIYTNLNMLFENNNEKALIDQFLN